MANAIFCFIINFLQNNADAANMPLPFTVGQGKPVVQDNFGF
jgi:hypothetical protein